MVAMLTVERASQIENGVITFTVKLSEPATDDVAVDYRLFDGTADVGTDVRGGFNGLDRTAGRLIFALGQQVATLSFTVGEVDVDENFALRLFNPDKAAFGTGIASIETSGFIVDTDGGLNRSIDVTDVVVSERPSVAAVFEVNISTPSGVPIILNYRTVPGTANAADFAPKTGTVSFAPGQTSARVIVPLRTDAAVETTESFALQIVPPFGPGFASGLIVRPATATITDYTRLGTPGPDLLIGTAGPERINGLDGNDTIVGGGGGDALIGGLGNDLISGGVGDDLMAGGAGNDSYVVDSTRDQVFEGAGPAFGNDLVASSVSLTLAANVERLRLLGTAALTGTGNALANNLVGNEGFNRLTGLEGDDVLRGNGGNDTLVGNGGNDVLDGGLGVDLMAGGLGNDLYIVSRGADRTLESGGLSGGLDQVNSMASVTLADSVERLFLLGIAALNGTGMRPTTPSAATVRATRSGAWPATTRCTAKAASTGWTAALGTTRCSAASGQTLFFSSLAGTSCSTSRTTSTRCCLTTRCSPGARALRPASFRSQR